MLNNKDAHTGAATPARARVEGGVQVDYITGDSQRQWRISDLLRRGGDNATTCRELASLTGWRDREITRSIEAERRAGTPICVNGAGYFLPANDIELDRYLISLQHREAEVRKTREAVALTRQQRMNLGGDV